MRNSKVERPRRMVRADDVINGRWTGEGFPFRYVVLWHNKEMVARARNSMIDTVLTAVEILEARGWELVSVDEAVSLACMRRVASGGHAGNTSF